MVTTETRDALKRLGQKGETYDDIIRHLLHISYRCPYPGCRYRGHSIDKLRRHYQKRHPDYCFICGTRVGDKSTLSQHAIDRLNLNPNDRAHMAVYALATGPSAERGGRRIDVVFIEALFERGLEVLEELTEIKKLWHEEEVRSAQTNEERE